MKTIPWTIGLRLDKNRSINHIVHFLCIKLLLRPIHKTTFKNQQITDTTYFRKINSLYTWNY